METLPDKDLRDLLQAAGIPNPNSYRPAEGGAATAIWRVEHAGQVSALRLFHADQRSVQALELEAMQLAHQRELPVPAVRAAGIWRERPFLLLEWCEGEPVLHTILNQPQQLEELSYQFGRFQAELHRRCQGATGVALRHTWLDWIPSIPADLRTILERLSQTPTLLHLDYHPLNLLSDGRKITALIDWTNAYLGDPRADLARTYTLLRIEPFQAGPEPQEFSTFRREFSHNWLRGYRDVLGSPHALAPFFAWAGHALVYDRLHRVADPNSWWQESHLDAIRSWTNRWEKRALKAYASLLEDR